MSKETNDILLERAREAQEYWTGTMWERIIQRDIDTNDLEALRYHLTESDREIAIQEESGLTEHDYELAMQLRDQMREDGISI